MVNAKHTRDSECTLDGEYDECTMCGTFHGKPCEHCGQRAFHLDECNRPAVTHVEHGWSMLGYYYVSFRADSSTTHFRCDSKRQSEVIAGLLRTATMAARDSVIGGNHA